MSSKLIEEVIYGDYDTGLKIFHPQVFGDERGYFFESYNQEKYNLPDDCDGYDRYYNPAKPFIQDNESCSTKGVMRGLHYQHKNDGIDYSQAKLVRVVKGAVIDFVLDIRKKSKLFGELFWFRLDDKNKDQLYVPHGYAHGFVSLEDNTIFVYKCDGYYNKASERGINMLDPKLKINEKILIPNGIDINNLIISDKDKVHPNFKDQKDLF